MAGSREPSCMESIPELCPARDRRPIKNAALQNEVESASASLAHAAASIVITFTSASCLCELGIGDSYMLKYSDVKH